MPETDEQADEQTEDKDGIIPLSSLRGQAHNIGRKIPSGDGLWAGVMAEGVAMCGAAAIERFASGRVFNLSD